MPEDKFTFLGRRIRAARKECKLTQQELADQSGLAVKTIQDIEKGRKNPTYETLCMLIDRLGVSPNTLFPQNLMLIKTLFSISWGNYSPAINRTKKWF